MSFSQFDFKVLNGIWVDLKSNMCNYILLDHDKGIINMYSEPGFNCPLIFCLLDLL